MRRKFAYISRIITSLLVAFWEIDHSRRIRLSRGVYFQIPKFEVTLFSGLLDDTQSMRLTLPQAVAVFRSIGDALRSNESKTVDLGDLKWTTDASASTIVFSVKFRPLSFWRVSVSRESAVAAMEDFEKKIISKLPIIDADLLSGLDLIKAANQRSQTEQRNSANG